MSARLFNAFGKARRDANGGTIGEWRNAAKGIEGRAFQEAAGSAMTLLRRLAIFMILPAQRA